ncbi:hypothetical protein OGAPHI_002477 [Ogataea philodendri]|uniref:Pre-mRNA-splicing factor CLF1 n=1 Tax=Ogataea philodendri TaxID=1378263 RepID=A0A9P8PAK8_9ASCO|nr:uncharacterized protein OGAPHI_002477 [Ogataea philodendri]KAH3668723.1 hypothetical protein OGAPHI_002477 [Ogataea philodendri]
MSIHQLGVENGHHHPIPLHDPKPVVGCQLPELVLQLRVLGLAQEKSADSNKSGLEFCSKLVIFCAPKPGSKNSSFIFGSVLNLMDFEMLYFSSFGLDLSKSSIFLWLSRIDRTSVRNLGERICFGLLLNDLRNFSVRKTPGAMIQFNELFGCSITLIPTLLRLRRSDAENSLSQPVKIAVISYGFGTVFCFFRGTSCELVISSSCESAACFCDCTSRLTWPTDCETGSLSPNTWYRELESSCSSHLAYDSSSHRWFRHLIPHSCANLYLSPVGFAATRCVVVLKSSLRKNVCPLNRLDETGSAAESLVLTAYGDSGSLRLDTMLSNTHSGRTIRIASFSHAWLNAAAIWHFSSSRSTATKWVVLRESRSVWIPPNDRTALKTASWSPWHTDAAQHTLTLLRKYLGSGEYGLRVSIRLAAMESNTQSSRTTGIISSSASWYSTKSVVLDTISVIFTSLSLDNGISSLSFLVTMADSSSNPALRMCLRMASAFAALSAADWMIRNRWPSKSDIRVLMSEAYEQRQMPPKAPNIKIADLEELREFQGRKRTEYEKALRVKRFDFGQWMRYAQFELDQHDYVRARSIFERALEVDHKQVPVWIRYVQTELKGKNINHARNLLDRATRLLPRVDKLWYQYITVEESVGDVIGTRKIFQNWLQWKPGPDVWQHYIQFELRYNEIENARLLFEQFVVAHPDSSTWLLWVDFERTHGDSVNVHNVYRLAAESLRQRGALDAKLVYSWIKWEVSQNNRDKAKQLFDFGFEHLSEKERVELRSDYALFEKQHGETASIEDSVLSKRIAVYEQELAETPSSYDTWWVYLKLVEPLFDERKFGSKLEQAVEVVPQSDVKSDWTSYIYLWIKYLIWQEPRDQEKTREFEFELRARKLGAARKLLGRSIGVCGDVKVIKYYIELETKLLEFDRVRMIYTKLVELYPRDAEHWIDFANLEAELGDRARCVAIFDLALDEVAVSARPTVLKAYIAYEMDERKYDNARRLQDRAVELAGDVKSLVARCMLELKIPTRAQLEEYERSGADEFRFEITEEAKDRSRDVFRSKIASADGAQKKQLVEALVEFERKYGDAEKVAAAEAQLPRLEKRFRHNAAGEEEEYYEYVFERKVHGSGDFEAYPSGELVDQGLGHGHGAERECGGPKGFGPRVDPAVLEHAQRGDHRDADAHGNEQQRHVHRAELQCRRDGEQHLAVEAVGECHERRVGLDQLCEALEIEQQRKAALAQHADRDEARVHALFWRQAGREQFIEVNRDEWQSQHDCVSKEHKRDNLRGEFPAVAGQLLADDAACGCGDGQSHCREQNGSVEIAGRDFVECKHDIGKTPCAEQS